MKVIIVWALPLIGKIVDAYHCLPLSADPCARGLCGGDVGARRRDNNNQDPELGHRPDYPWLACVHGDPTPTTLVTISEKPYMTGLDDRTIEIAGPESLGERQRSMEAPRPWQE